eukprot:270637-Chlamydomonas_euryale.AAC.1
MNSLAVPRKAKEAIGAISLLKHTDGSSMVRIKAAEWGGEVWGKCGKTCGARPDEEGGGERGVVV